METNNCLQHLVIENAYVRYRCCQIQNNNDKLERELTELKQKLENVYKNHANIILMLQEKNQNLHKMIQSTNQPQKMVLFADIFEDE